MLADACHAAKCQSSGHLGHTGGQAIPCYDLKPILKGRGCIFQTSALAPADYRTVRDVTATVESVALITASILSKLASGLDALVMDIKVGNGAFMNSMNEARGSPLRLPMRQGLRPHVGYALRSLSIAPVAGNALEIAECVDPMSSSSSIT